MTEEGTAVTCKVTNTPTHLNEANVLVLKSLLPGAGLGLFLRPTPPTSRGPLIVPEDGLVCVYSRTATTANVDDMASTDYLIEVASGGDTVRFNPEVFNGDETGRFINQGGLIEGLEAMCRACDRDSGATSYALADVRREIAQHCNVTYRLQRLTTLHVVARRELRSSSDPLELLADYNIDYWLRYVVANIDTLGRSSQLVKYVLWTLLSEHSAYDGQVVDTGGIPEELVEEYRDMRCPVQQRQRRSTRH